LPEELAAQENLFSFRDLARCAQFCVALSKRGCEAALIINLIHVEVNKRADAYGPLSVSFQNHANGVP